MTSERASSRCQHVVMACCSPSEPFPQWFLSSLLLLQTSCFHRLRPSFSCCIKEWESGQFIFCSSHSSYVWCYPSYQRSWATNLRCSLAQLADHFLLVLLAKLAETFDSAMWQTHGYTELAPHTLPKVSGTEWQIWDMVKQSSIQVKAYLVGSMSVPKPKLSRSVTKQSTWCQRSWGPYILARWLSKSFLEILTSPYRSNLRKQPEVLFWWNLSTKPELHATHLKPVALSDYCTENVGPTMFISLSY